MNIIIIKYIIPTNWEGKLLTIAWFAFPTPVPTLFNTFFALNSTPEIFFSMLTANSPSLFPIGFMRLKKLFE